MSDNQMSDVDAQQNKYMLMDDEYEQRLQQNQVPMMIPQNNSQQFETKISKKPHQISYLIKDNIYMNYVEIKSELMYQQVYHYNQAIGGFLKRYEYFNQTQVLEIVNIILGRKYFSMRDLHVAVKNVWTIGRFFTIISKKGQELISYLKVILEVLNRSNQYYHCIYTPSQILSKFQKMCKENKTQSLWNSITQMMKQYGAEQGSITTTELLYSYSLYLVIQLFIQPIINSIRKGAKNQLKTNQQKNNELNLKIFVTVVLTKIPKEQLNRIGIVEMHKQLLMLTKDQYRDINKNYLQLYCLSVVEMTEVMQAIDKQTQFSALYVYPLILQHLMEESSVERKILGMKMLTQKLHQAKLYPDPSFIKWLNNSAIIQRLLRDDSHTQILRKIPLVLRFLHQNNQINQKGVQAIIEKGLNGHEQLLKVVQSFIMCLKIEQLDEVFDIVRTQSELECDNVVSLISSIVNSPHLMGPGRKKSNKYKPVRRTPMSEQFIEQEEEEEIDLRQQKLVIKLFTFLIKVIQTHQNLYMNTLSKLICSQQRILINYIPDELLNLLRKSHVCAIWVLENCLKMELPKEKNHPTFKYQFISKLASEGLYEYLFALLARNRFNKLIVDKVISVLIYLCRWFKPLEKYQTQFLWRVLGLRSVDEKEREQFFIFIKQALRYDSLLSEDSVNYIYFQVLMRQHHQWFSLRVYDCLEMLFMRLNEDCKQITYITSNQQYQINDPQLIGLQKFWYIYFHCQDFKVVKKCREFLCRLAGYPSDVRGSIYQRFSEVILGELRSNNRNEVTMRRAFEIMEKIMQGKREDHIAVPNSITINVHNITREALPPIKMLIKFPDNTTLASLRQQIGDSLNPPNRQIKLMTRANYLKGENMTLRELQVDNNQTIMVQNSTDDNPQIRNRINQENLKQIQEIFGMQYEEPVLRYLVQKMEGQNLQKIMQFLMDEDRMHHIIMQVQQKDNEGVMPTFGGMQNDDFNPILGKSEVELVPLDFGKMMLFRLPNLMTLLECAEILQDPLIIDRIKKMPLNEDILNDIQRLTLQQKWEQLLKFPCEKGSLIVLYYIHVISIQIGSSQQRLQELLKKRKGEAYFIQWLAELAKEDGDVRIINGILDVIFKNISNPVLTLYQEFLASAGQPGQLLTQLSYLSIPPFSYPITTSVAKSLLKKLTEKDLGKDTAKNIFKYIVCFLLQSKYNDPHEAQQIIFGISSTDMYHLLIRYGKMAEYILLFSLTILPNTSQQSLVIFTNLSKYIGNQYIQNNQNIDYMAYYDCVGTVLSQCEGVNWQNLLKLFQQINCVLRNPLISQSQLSSILSLIDIACKSKLPIQLSEILIDISLWIYQNMLFELDNPHLHIRSKIVRKKGYKALIRLCTQNVKIRQIIQECVLSQKIQKKKKSQEDVVDFRDMKLMGIKNLGATCYINALLQQLYHTRMSLILLESDNEQKMNNEDEGLSTEKMNGDEIKQNIKEGNVGQSSLYSLKKLLVELHMTNKNLVNPRQFISSILFYGEAINPSIQQDSTQFLLCLLDHIERNGGQKALDNVFGGTLCNEITGLQQGEQFIKYNQQHFKFISIDIKGKKNLHQGLAFFIKGQILDNQNMYFSEQLGRKTKATKRTFFQKMPNILIFTLKRFQFDYENMIRQKLNDYFEFPMDLDMYRYSAIHLKHNQDQSSGYKYRLVGVVVHSGSAESGHYYSYIRLIDKWYEFNDWSVTDFNIQNLKNQCFGAGNDGRSRNAYMLFYEKVDSNSHGLFLDQLPPSNKIVQRVMKDNSVFLKNRLVYDSSYVDFLVQLNELNKEERLTKLIEMLSPDRYLRDKQNKVDFITDLLTVPLLQQEGNCPQLDDALIAENEIDKYEFKKEDQDLMDILSKVND